MNNPTHTNEEWGNCWIVDKPKDERKVVRLYVQFDKDTDITTDLVYTDVPEDLKSFIRSLLHKQKEQQQLVTNINLLKQNIGLLRQWLNEDRITDPNKFVTNEELLHWLNLKQQ